MGLWSWIRESAPSREITGEPLNSRSRILAPNKRKITGFDCIDGDGPLLASDGSFDGSLSFHLEVRHHHVPVQCGQVDDWTKVACLLLHQEQPAVEHERCPVDDSLYGSLGQQGIHSLLESWQLFLARKLVHWWVSWGRCRKDMPIPSSTVLVARQVPSKLHHCGAKSARRAPTWTPSMLAGWGNCLRCPGRDRLRILLPAPARKDWSWVIVLWTVVVEGEPKCSNTEALECWFFLVEEVFFVLVWVDSLVFWMNVTDDPAIRSACLMVRTHYCRTLGSRPRMWDPSKGEVLTVLRTCGCKPKRPAVTAEGWRRLRNLLRLLPLVLPEWWPASLVLAWIAGP